MIFILLFFKFTDFICDQTVCISYQRVYTAWSYLTSGSDCTCTVYIIRNYMEKDFLKCFL